MALTADQVKRRDTAAAKYQLAVTDYNAKKLECDNIFAANERNKAAALECDAKRAQYDLGWRKDQACGNRSQLYAWWNQSSQNLQTRQNQLLGLKTQMDAAMENINRVNAQIDAEVLAAQKALELDPAYQQQVAQQKLQASEQEILHKERVMKNVLIFLGVLIIAVGIVYLFRSGTVKIPTT